MDQIRKFYKPRLCERLIRKSCLKFPWRSLQGRLYVLLEAPIFQSWIEPIPIVIWERKSIGSNIYYEREGNHEENNTGISA